MLVLSRRLNEKILFPTLGVSVEITSVARNVVRLGIDAPAAVPIVRAEIVSESDKFTARNAHLVNRHRLRTATLGIRLAQKQLQTGLMNEAEETLDEALREFSRLEIEMAAEKADGHHRQIRTLLVEDNRNECVLLAEFLRVHGINVQMAYDDLDALDYLRSHERPDAILLEMRMPRLGGPAMLAAIRGDAANDATKVFAVTGTDPQEISLPAGSRGLDGWFTKPVNPSKLVYELNLALCRN